MDSLTHVVLGACISEAMLGRKLGKKAMLLGAVAQSLPDIDFIAALWMGPAQNLLAHRGITHSILFAIIITALSAFLLKRFYRSRDITTSKWAWLIGLNIFVHIFIDAFNAYGVGWFEPFSQYRVSFNSMFVADPLFSIWPGIAFVALLFLSAGKKSRIKWARLGLILPSFYLLMGMINKLIVERDIKKIAAKENISYKRFFSTPTPFNNLLWYVVMENDSGYNVIYRSVFDSRQELTYNYFPRKDYLLQKETNNNDLKYLEKFSQGYYTAEQWNDTLVFNILRFGQETGWANPEAHFAFHYYLNDKADNKYVLQRGRFAGWDWNVARSLISRIKGN